MIHYAWLPIIYLTWRAVSGPQCNLFNHTRHPRHWSCWLSSKPILARLFFGNSSSEFFFRVQKCTMAGGKGWFRLHLPIQFTADSREWWHRIYAMIQPWNILTILLSSLQRVLSLSLSLDTLAKMKQGSRFTNNEIKRFSLCNSSLGWTMKWSDNTTKGYQQYVPWKRCVLLWVSISCQLQCT